MSEINSVIRKIIEDQSWPNVIYIEHIQLSSLEELIADTKVLKKYTTILNGFEVIVIDPQHIYNITYYNKKSKRYFNFTDRKPKVLQKTI